MHERGGAAGREGGGVRVSDPTLGERIVKAIAAMLWEERYLREHIISEGDWKRLVEGAGLEALGGESGAAEE